MPRRPARPSAELIDLRESWKRTLLAENKSQHTIDVYCSAVDRLADHLEATKGPVTVAEISRTEVEAFIAHLPRDSQPATASNRYRALQAFFGWCVREGELGALAHGDDAAADGTGISSTGVERRAVKGTTQSVRGQELRGSPRYRDDPPPA